MLKNIKTSIKYFIIVSGIIILLPTVFYLFLQIPEVQTLLVKRITSHFSNEFKSTLSVGSIEYKFFNKLSISDLLIKDKNNDTLIFSDQINVVIKRISLKNNTLRFGRVMVLKPVIQFVTDSSGVMNLTWFLDLLKNSSDTAKQVKNKISIDQIDISGARFSMINHTVAKSKTRMDLNNLNFIGINGIVEDLRIGSDTTSFNIYNFVFKEMSGFTVSRMNCSVALAKQCIRVNSAFLNLDSSILNIPKILLTSDSSGFLKNFSKDTKLDIQLNKSLISTSDLEYFLPISPGLNESAWLSGRVFGTISELRGRDIKLSYRDYTSLDCDFDFSGLPGIENAFIYIGVNNFQTNASDIEKITIPAKGKLLVPEVLHKLGNISFDGSFTGFITDFVTYGQFRTAVGNIRTDISLRPEAIKKYRVKGLLSGNDIDLGKITGKSKFLGKLSVQANVDGYAYSLNRFSGNLTGKIDSVEINSYTYRNIALNGLFTDKTWDGSVKIADSNLKLDLLGMFNFNNKLPEFNFTLNLSEADLFNLNIDRLDTTSRLSMLLTSNFKGNSIDNLDGEIKLVNSSYRRNNKILELNDFSIRTYTGNNEPVLSLRTDFVDADIKGYYNFAAIRNLIESTLATLMPSQFPVVPKRNDQVKNNFVFEINFKNTDKINSFFGTGVLLADKSYINGYVFPDSIMRIGGKTKSLNIKNVIISDLTFDAIFKSSVLSLDINSSSLLLIGKSELKGLSVNLLTEPDKFTFKVDWDNKDKILNKGNFIARGSIVKNINLNANAILLVEIDSTQIFSRNNRWKISQSSINIDSNAIKLNKFYITNNDRYYLIDGIISENPSDTLNLAFKDIDISPLNYLENKNSVNDPNKVPLNFKGQLNGKILLNNVYRNLLLESDIVVNNFSLLSSEYGNVFIKSTLDNTKKIVNITASNNLAGVKMIDIKGYYDPLLKKIDLTANANRLNIDALNPLLKFFASGITGFVSGKVNLAGPTDKLVLTGAVMAENASMKIDYLQTRYKLNDSVRFDREGIKFNNVRLTDEKGNNVVLSGAVRHTNFKNYAADLLVNIVVPNECLVLNTKPKDNPLFYGTAYASGITTIKSGPNSVVFDISAKTGKNTKFYIQMNSGLSVSDHSFISFIEPDNKKEADSGMDLKKNSYPPPSATNKTAIDINFDLEVTPEAEAQIIFDSKVGDIMKGHGSGNLNITYNKNGEFKMSGDYIIDDGDYLFTAGNILNKSFTVENGGKIMFNGDIDNAEIDVKAIYRLRASLDVILQDTSLRERIPVECQLNLTGKLFNPIVSFDIYLPTANEQERTNLRNAISTQEELSRQFAYLLVMNSFYSDPSYSSQVVKAPSGTAAMAVTTTEMLSNQLSNWISQISKDFDIGFLYRPGSGNINPQEVQVALSTQLLNDKVTINGNFDVKGTGSNATSNDQITGEFDAEIRLTEKIKFKVFNRFNDTESGKGPYTQGIGVFFKEDFNKFSDLFRKRIKSDMKKEDEPTVIKQ